MPKWMTKDEAKKMINQHEYYLASSGRRLSGVEVSIVNIKIHKDFVTADVITKNDELTERIDGCEYPKSFFI